MEQCWRTDTVCLTMSYIACVRPQSPDRQEKTAHRTKVNPQYSLYPIDGLKI